MTLRSLSDLCTELGTKAKVSFDNHNLKVDEYRGFNQEWKKCTVQLKLLLDAKSLLMNIYTMVINVSPF